MNTAEQAGDSMMVKEQTWYTAEEAAGILSERTGIPIGAGWLYRRTRQKAIPHHRFGKYVRFSPEDIRGILQAAAVQPQTESQ